MSAVRRWAAIAIIAACVVLVYWAVAWSSVEVLLARDAQARAAAWEEEEGTPWRWRLQERDAVVWPGSVGFERAESFTSILAGRIPDGNADLSLNLRGEAVDLTLVAGASLSIETDAPVRATLLAGNATAPVFASARVAPPGGETPMHAGSPPAGHARILRLHLEAEPDAQVTLRGFALLPRAGLRIGECADATDCNLPLARMRAPDFAFPESTLHWRDAQLRSRPAAIVEPHCDAPATTFADDVRLAMLGPTTWLFGLTPAFVALMSRLRRAPVGRATAALELALVFAPWLLLQWTGWPGDDAPARTNWIFAGSLAGAAMMRGPDDVRWLGDRTGWNSAGLCAAGALIVIAGAALSNALDNDGFAPRTFAPEKAWQYPLWALLQQWILLCAIAPRSRIATGSSLGGALVAGGIFGLLHTPNFALMIATFAAGTAWAALGYRQRALLPLVAVHVATGLLLLWAAPPWLLRSAEIGGRYLMAP